MKKQTLKLAAVITLLALMLTSAVAGVHVAAVRMLAGKHGLSRRAAIEQAKIPGSPSYTFTLLNYPGDLATFATGINKGATTTKMGIVGSYNLETDNGLLVRVSGTKTVTESYQTVNDPNGAVQQFASDVNDLGQIVGTFQDSSGFWHGYKRSGGKFTQFDVPFSGAYDTYAPAINNSGEIVGTYNAPGGEEYGFTLIGSTYTSIGYPGAFYTQFSNVNSNGDIVGQYADASGVFQGFVLSGGTYTPINFPGATETFATGINDSGEIVGVYCPTTGCIETLEGAQGFVFSAGTYTTFAIPGEFYTQPIDINNNGVIVGYYQDAAGLVGSFMATPSN